MRVVVIGGGLAGTAAALDLADAGQQVTLLESRGRLGGAAYSFTREGLKVDNGQHVFLRCCSEYQRLLTRIGAADLVTMQPALNIPVVAPGGHRATLAAKRLPAPLHLAGSLLRYSHLTPAKRISVALAMRALGRVDPDDPAADARSFGDWLAEHRQNAAAIETVWELITRPTLNLRVGDASLAQAAYVFQQGLLSDPRAGDIGHARVPLSEIHDRAAHKALSERGVDVHLRSGAKEISPDLQVSLSGQPTISADAVVLATGPDRAARLGAISPATAESLSSSPIVNLHIKFDRQVMDEEFIATVHSPAQWIFSRDGRYLAVSLSAAEEELEMTAEELRARFLPALAELLGPANVEHFFVTREHAATFRAAPGSRKLRPGPVTDRPGLFLAGAWTDTGWPATMEGAVRSGQRAAAAALAYQPVRQAVAA